MKLLRWLGIGLGALVVLLAAVAFGARYADGPIAIFPGGAFQSGEWVREPVDDWSFAGPVQEIELQSGSPPTSRTVWILVDGQEAYVPCSLGFPPGKRWHTEALTNPDAVVRIDGRLYPRKLEKVEDEALQDRLRTLAEQKYGGGPPGDSGVWFFHLAPPG
jgi:hypothetical protein